MYTPKKIVLALLTVLVIQGASDARAQSCISSLLPCQCSVGDIAVTGEFLLWQPQISGMAYAATNILTPTPFGFSVANDILYHEVEFDYKPGFRIGAEYTVPCSDWNCSLTWTSLRTSGFDSVVASGDRVISTFWEQPSVITADYASSCVHVDLCTVDFNVGKTINVCSHFFLTPYVGASYFKLNIDNDIIYTGTIVTLPAEAEFTGTLFNYSNGYGLNIGMNALWELPCGFGFYGTGSYSLYKSRCNNTILQSTVVTTTSQTLAFNSNNKFSILNQLFRVSCGLSWDYATCIQSCPIDITIFAGFELNYWPNQIELKRAQFSGSETSVIPLDTSGDVGFNGLTTGVSILF